MNEFGIKIFLEGDTDKKFIQDFIRYWNIEVNNIDYQTINGKDENSILKSMELAYTKEQLGKNVFILDLDEDSKQERLNSILELASNTNISISEESIYFFPDNDSEGTIEDLIITMFSENSIASCFESYTQCLTKINSDKFRHQNIGKKELVYHYKLLHLKKEQNSNRSKYISDRHTDYTNTNFWNISKENDGLNRLKNFLKNQLIQQL